MLALFRLALGAFLLGGGMVLFHLLARMICALFSPLPADFPLRLRERLPVFRGKGKQTRRGHPRRRAILRFFGDVFLSMAVAVAFILFLFWYGDGIPRLFVFLAAGGGALMAHSILSPLFSRAECSILFLTRLLLLRLLNPILFLAEKIGKAFLFFLRKVGGFFIKRMQRQNTKHRSRRYEKKAVQRLSGKQLQARLLAALSAGSREDGI